jgi:LPLT family lysophospholipid transporter-like MFS transporter
VHPLLAYAVVGLGAAAYSPAKYGILTEYLPHRLLVVANGWIEGPDRRRHHPRRRDRRHADQPDIAAAAGFRFPADRYRGRHVGEMASARSPPSICSPRCSTSTSRHRRRSQALHKNPFYLMHEFNHCLMLLWRDKLGQISLAVTTLFWGAGATLQFIVIKWAERRSASICPRHQHAAGRGGVGVAIGAILAARIITLRKSVRVIPLGIAMG